MPRIAFIIGSGRSGSTILHELIGHHPRVGWMSHLCDVRPLDPSANRRALSATRWPLVGPLLRRHYEPTECYRFFDVSYPGFSAPVRDLTAADLTARAGRDIRARLEAIAPADRDTIVVKLTGWPRVGFLVALFPDATFVHLMRDGRAVASSLLQVPWWHGWRGPDNWRFGPLPEAYEAEWKSHEMSFTALAAIEWKLVMDALESSRPLLGEGQLIDVRYEDLCSDDGASMRRIVQHLGLDWAPELEAALRRFPLENRNDKWRDDLGEHNAGIAESVLRDSLERYGYRVE